MNNYFILPALISAISFSINCSREGCSSICFLSVLPTITFIATFTIKSAQPTIKPQPKLHSVMIPPPSVAQADVNCIKKTDATPQQIVACTLRMMLNLYFRTKTVF